MKLTVKKLRTEKGWTLDQLASVSGISKGFLSQLENGKRQPSSSILTTLADTFGVHVSEMIEVEQDSAAQALLQAFGAMSEDDKKALLHLAQKMAGLPA